MLNNNNKLILAEQTAHVYRALPLSLIGSLLAAVVFVVVMWPITPATHLLSWAISFGIIILLRGLLYVGFQRSANQLASHWVKLFNGGVLLAGCAWGAISLWLFPVASLPHQVFIAFLISGVVSAAAVSLSALWSSFLLFILPTLLPLIYKLLIFPSSINLAITAGAIIFMTVMTVNARNANYNTKQNIMLRQQSIENEKTRLASQYELEESRHMLRWVLDTIPVSVFWKDTQGVYLGCNQVFAKELGLTADKIIGKTAAQLPSARNGLICHCNEQSVIENNTPALHQEHCVVLGEGKIRWVDCSLAPLTDIQGNVIGVLGTSLDITEHKRLDEIKNEFISTISHELRTPLTSIRGAIGLLLGIKSQQHDKQSAELMAIAHNNTERLLLLIDDLLNIQKIESGYMDFDFEPVRLLPFMQQVLKDNLSLAARYGVSFSIEKANDHAMVNADPHRLTQVITNLLSNAAKFSSTGQNIEIGISCDEQNGHVYIQDHGVGIPLAFHDKVFDRFTQWDASNTRKVGGTGLGLNIVKTIIERHGGRISFDSQEGTGTRFEIELPLYKPEILAEPVV